MDRIDRYINPYDIVPFTMNRTEYMKIRTHFFGLLGGHCTECDTEENLEIHHIVPCRLGGGRGRDNRAWNWFDEYAKNNLSLMCHKCHFEHHKKEDGKK